MSEMLTVSEGKSEAIMGMIKDEEIRFVDLRFTDSIGKEQHVTIPARQVDHDFFAEGKMFDGSSIRGWAKINSSDMILMPDPESAVIDPFYEEKTLLIRCNIVDPTNMLDYERDPRSLARRAEAYLKSTGIADTVYFGPEPEFFIFDDVRFDVNMSGAFYSVDTEEGAWNSGRNYDGGNRGHRPFVKGGYFPVPPVDSSQDMRSEMCLILESLGMVTEAHHHEVATGNQNELAFRFNTLLKKADELLLMKYVVLNVAHRRGCTATFMPKPLVGDNGSGMHCHQSLFKNGDNIFAGDKYAGMSDNALYYIGGILKHAKALNAFTNPSTNSYRRLVPGYEAPVMLAYSARNRSAAIRIPHVNNPKARRIEVRFPDPMANPYLAFSAMMMAGLDGIRNKIHPGDPMDKDLYDLPPEEAKTVPGVCSSLDEALDMLEQNHDFLTVGDVFSKSMLDAYIGLKREECKQVHLVPNPAEFELYYSL
jgi:glutamine synthetase